MRFSISSLRAHHSLYILILWLMFAPRTEARKLSVTEATEDQQDIISFVKLHRRLVSSLATVRLQNGSGDEEGEARDSFPVSPYSGRVEWVTAPDLACNEYVNCSAAYSMPLVCSDDGKCECVDPLCWIYSVDSSGFFLKIYFSCDWCGQLGSECSEDVTCDYPGVCGEDKFCHCPQGEHKGDICYAHSGSILLQFLVGGLVVALILVGTVVIYQTILSYRHHRTFCWCTYSSRCRRRHHPQAGGVHRRRRTLKSPAYTTQQLIFQNFSREDDDEEKEELHVRHRSSVNSDESESVTSSSLENEDSHSRTQGFSGNDHSSATQEETPIEARTHEETQEPDGRSDEDSGTLSLQAVQDESGMTEYYNSFSHSVR